MHVLFLFYARFRRLLFPAFLLRTCMRTHGTVASPAFAHLFALSWTSVDFAQTRQPGACMQIATTGILSLTYHHRVNDKAALAADFLYNVGAPSEACASVGYDYTFRQCRLRGSVDSNGKVAALLEEALAPGVRLLLSGELDHARADHKFGFGMTFGE